LIFGYDASNRNIACMSQAIYHEARGESKLGKIAVGHVILNRIKQGYGSNPCEIVATKNQFSWYGKQFSIKEEIIWKDCLRLSKDILDNKTLDPTLGSIFFHERNSRPKWKYKKVTVIGRHIFYKKY
jgi:spore germination cell wall hydrolase CwlJ-like protein